MSTEIISTAIFPWLIEYRIAIWCILVASYALLSIFIALKVFNNEKTVLNDKLLKQYVFLVGTVFLILFLLFAEFLMTTNYNFFGPVFILIGSMVVFSLELLFKRYNYIMVKSQKNEDKLRTLEKMILHTTKIDLPKVMHNAKLLKTNDKLEPVDENFWDFLFENLNDYNIDKHMTEIILEMRINTKSYNKWLSRVNRLPLENREEYYEVLDYFLSKLERDYNGLLKLRLSTLQ